MIIVIKPEATIEQIDFITDKLKSYGYKLNVSRGVERTIIGAIGEEGALRDKPIKTFPGVENVIPILKPYKLVSRDFKKEDTVIDVRGIKIGGAELSIMAGPCSVESFEMIRETARRASSNGARILRGGAFKPRTSPYAFQGMGPEGLVYLRKAADEFGMLVVTELTDPRDLDIVAEYADIIQIGARNMQNFRLLHEVGRQEKPVLLKRGMSATIKDFLLAAEHVANEGNMNIIFCERGIRTFETETRNTLDLSCIPIIKNVSHFPIIVDPSHGTGKKECIAPMSQAAVAAGADGLMIEVHPCPEEALSDGDQSLTPDEYDALIEKVRIIAGAVGKTVAK